MIACLLLKRLKVASRKRRSRGRGQNEGRGMGSGLTFQHSEQKMSFTADVSNEIFDC